MKKKEIYTPGVSNWREKKKKKKKKKKGEEKEEEKVVNLVFQGVQSMMQQMSENPALMTQMMSAPYMQNMMSSLTANPDQETNQSPINQSLINQSPTN